MERGHGESEQMQTMSGAVLMADRERSRTVRGLGVFGRSLLRTLSGAGDFHATLAAPVYPRDAQSQDLQRIGRDMYRAMERDAETLAAQRR